MKLKLFIMQFITTCIILPYIGVFVTLMVNDHKFLAGVWIFAGAAVTVAVEEIIRAIKRKLKGR